MSRRRGGDPHRLADSIAAVGAELRMPGPDVVERLLAAWPAIVGRDVADHVTVRAVRDGVLTVVADDPAWASQFRYLDARVRARVDEEVARGLVRAIRVVVERPS